MGREDCCHGYIGTSFRATKWLSVNGCGLSCVAISALLHVYGAIGLFLFLFDGELNFWSILFFVTYGPVFILAELSLFMTWWSDPGAVPLGARPLDYMERNARSITSTTKSIENGLQKRKLNPLAEPLAGDVGAIEEEEKLNNSVDQTALQLRDLEEGAHQCRNVSTNENRIEQIMKPSFKISRCDRCNGNFKPPRAHHNHITGRCIVKLDHYCPWVGNAIGALNHKHFCLFIFYTLVASVLAMILISIKLLRDCPLRMNDNTNDDHYDRDLLTRTSILTDCQKNNLSLPALFLLVESVYFFFFTLIMLINQVTAITENTSMIAQRKLRRREATREELGRVTNEFNEMFGGNSNSVQWHWFVPLPVQFPEGMRDVILGYKWDPSFGNEPWAEKGDAFDYKKLPVV